MINELMSIVLKSAPTIATALGSPVAGLVTSLIAGAIGGDPKNITDLVQKITADPVHCHDALCQLESEHGGLIKNLLVTRTPTKLDLHVIIDYKDVNNEQG